jgi:hypothetical protein
MKIHTASNKIIKPCFANAISYSTLAVVMSHPMGLATVFQTVERARDGQWSTRKKNAPAA